MKYLLFFITILFVCASCHNPNSYKKKTPSITNYKNCFANLDTTFSNGDYVKYILIDSLTDIEVQLKNKKLRLGWLMPCDIPEVLVPKCSMHTDNLLLFERGQSTSYREIIVCEFLNNYIVTNRYETELGINCDVDFFVYKLSSEKTKLFMKGIFDLKKVSNKTVYDKREIRTISLPKEYQNETLINTNVYDNYVHAHFANNKEFDFKLK